MPLSRIDSRYLKHSCDRYRQGDILRDITLVEWAEQEGDELVIKERCLPYSIVVSQDCDLLHDFNARGDASKPNQDKYLQKILLCPAYPAEQLKEGTHLDAMGLKRERMNSDRWRQLKQNNFYRYHYLPGLEELQIPSLVIDFKDYTTVPREVLYRESVKDSYIGSLSEIFREDLSTRFAQYLSRIALPDIVTEAA